MLRKSVLLAAAIFATTAQAGKLVGDVEFNASAKPGFLEFQGTGAKLDGATVEGTDGTVSGTFEVNLTPIKTGKGFELRDEHMHDKYLDTKKHPTAKLTLNAVKPGESFDWTGTLTLKGNTKPVKGKAKLAADGTFEAEFAVNLSDYPEIGAPKYELAGKTIAEVANEVSVKVTAKYTK
jgi:polyisoprenoid-binding protein YceI